MGVDDVATGKKVIMATMRSAGPDLGRINYRNFNSLQKFHEDQELEKRYDKLMARVGATVATQPEYVRLLSYIILFSADLDAKNGANVSDEDRKRVERLQEMLCNMLRRFIESKYPRKVAVGVFANLLSCIGDLKELTHIKRLRSLAKPDEDGPPRQPQASPRLTEVEEPQPGPSSGQ